MAASPSSSPRKNNAQVTSLLPNHVLTRLERLRINTQTKFTNHRQGAHLRNKGGSSTEFADFRDYVEGDDLRFLDWNSFSRLNRPYVKLFHQEEEMHVLLLLDASNSMLLENKLTRARQLAAALGHLALRGTERLSIHALQDDSQLLAPCRGRTSLGKMFAFLESIKGGGAVPLEKAVETALKHHRGRGVVVLLSDFLTFGDLKRSFNLLFSAGLEIFGLQILGPSELDPELTGDVRLIDSELKESLDVSSVADLLAIYQEYLRKNQEETAALCRRSGGRFLSLNAEDPLEHALFDQMQRRGWLL